MRWGAVLGLAVLLAGCVGDSSPPAAPADASPSPAPTSEARADAGAAALPDLPLGLALTYALDGVYDVQGDVTLVVAKKGPEGYLMAGATERDVVEAAVWGRLWQGKLDAGLNPARARLFDHPLSDGKTWRAWEGLEVTARAADIVLPNGTERGFVVEGTSKGGARLLWTYAPSLGTFTEFSSASKGVVYEHATLKSVGRASAWVWFTPELRAAADEATPAATLQVPEGMDALLASAGGTGGRAALLPPPPATGSAWTWEGSSPERWDYEVLPATPGAWTLVAKDGAEGGSAYVAVVAVKWVRGTV